MSFVQEKFNRSFLQTQGIFNEYAYNPDNGDSSTDVLVSGYFAQCRFIGEDGWIQGIVLCNLSDGFFTMQIQEDEVTAIIVDIVIPPGGITGQALVKLSNASGDVGWGAGSTDFIPGKTVNNFAALPLATEWTGFLAICVNSQGVWFVNYKAAGIYYSDGANWVYQGDYELTDSASEIYNTPAGNITATNVQAAIDELDDEKGVVDSVNSGTDITVDNTDPANPVINFTGSFGVAWGAITGPLSSQTDLQTALDAKVDENAAITGATKTKITYDTKGLVTSGADATTADIADSTNKRYVTDAQLTVIGNTSGINTGDQNLSGLVPYSGATGNVNVGANSIDAADFNGVALTAAGSASNFLAEDGSYYPVSGGSGLTQMQVEGLI